ncbi:hypothetical protein Patl1_06954 [Pistacia atlantica]|uniref:Uncharacterized protein n=1 Tax=Pistacia atlantica TaxID=434234 RepID=A0ACC1AHC9_9ROSI|nr:hypothetical protein Patl1_06954 [Pistacia atlantica]
MLWQTKWMVLLVLQMMPRKNVFDLGAFVGDLTFEEDASGDDISLEGLAKELEECKKYDDYNKESDNLVSLHDQIRDCDAILSQIETLLSSFQSVIGFISLNIKILQEKLMDMGLKLKNRKVMESINNIICLLTKVVTSSLRAARKSKNFHSDVGACKLQPFMEKDSGGGEIFFLWAELVFDFIVQKLCTLRKPKTNIQILQQNILLKYNLSFAEIPISTLEEIDQPALIPHISEANSLKYPYEVFFRSLHKLLMDTATSEYLFALLLDFVF